MARLLKLDSEQTVLLRTTHVFGRSSSAVNTRITDANVSRVHASLVWQNFEWVLQDKSTNGTFVNNTRVQKDTQVKLQPGDIIQFGSPQADKWQLESDDAPVSILVPRGGSEPELQLKEMLVLPNEDSPELTFYQDEQRNWLCETQETTTTLEDGDVLESKDKSWTFVSNTSDAETHFATFASQDTFLTMQFKVSQNEEHVTLSIKYGQHQFDLGNKTYNYLLLLLARQWLSDKQNKVPDIDCGWLDKSVLCKELRTQEQYMNIQIYRHRKQLSAMLPDGLILPPSIERRLREVRLNCHAIDIQGGNAFS